MVSTSFVVGDKVPTALLVKFLQHQDSSCTISEVAGPGGRGQESGACTVARLVREHGSRQHSTSSNSFIAEDLLPFGRHVGRASRLVLFPRTDRSRIRRPHMELLPLVERIECRLCQLWAATLRFNNKSTHADSLCTAVKEPQPEEVMVLFRRGLHAQDPHVGWRLSCWHQALEVRHQVC